MVSSRPKYGTGPFLNFFRCSNDFITQSVFLTANESLRWLNNVSGVFLVQVSLLLIGSRVWDISSGIYPCFLLAGELANCTPTPEENDKYSANQS
jgi:hypothetical protein